MTSVKELLNSETYQSQASKWATSDIIVSLIVAGYLGLNGNVSLGWHWLWVLPSIIYGTSLIISMPTMMVNVFLASNLSKYTTIDQQTLRVRVSSWHGIMLKILQNIWSIISVLIAGWATCQFILWVN